MTSPASTKLRTLLLFGMVGASSCGPRAPLAPSPIPAPLVVAEGYEAPAEREEVVFAAPQPVVHDAILSSPMVRDPDFLREVERWVAFWQGRGAQWLPEYLERMAWFAPAVDSVLSNRELPASLRYLPIVESGYSPRAVSRVSAVGLWQFMAPTARGFGMWVGPLLDERRNPIKSTAAAGDYLAQLHDRFGSWFLALAAYNSGPYRVQRVLDRHAPLAPRSDSVYWAIRHRLPRETRDFVPKFFAAAAVASDPTAYGIRTVEAVEGFEFDEVVVPDATTLDVVALAAGTTQVEIERLNPEVLRGITPPGRSTALRVPAGTGATFEEAYAKIPPSDRVTFVEHRVARGETLTHIALRYGVHLDDLKAANPRVKPRLLQVGQRITVPIAPRARASAGAS
jgi:membrane-bound lytic murein transglycosylase D